MDSICRIDAATAAINEALAEFCEDKAWGDWLDDVVAGTALRFTGHFDGLRVRTRMYWLEAGNRRSDLQEFVREPLMTFALAVLDDVGEPCEAHAVQLLDTAGVPMMFPRRLGRGLVYRMDAIPRARIHLDFRPFVQPCALTAFGWDAA